MKTIHNLSQLPWSLSGFTPHQWQFPGETVAQTADIPAIPARVPGSVQASLRDAGLLPDWNIALNSRLCEWVENRHWIFETTLSDNWLTPGKTIRLRCLGLDYSGWVFLNSREVGTFRGSLTPHDFDLTSALNPTGNRLKIIFDLPPRWLGQHGFTSRMTDWKPRFNYTWDWMPRLVQIGIWDDIFLEITDAPPLSDPRCILLGPDSLRVSHPGGLHALTLADGPEILRQETFENSLTWTNLPVEPWQPNGVGPQKLYTLTLSRPSHASHTWRIGFKSVRWLPCKNAPAYADPWLCEINGKPLFLQGVNWTPIRPNFADVTADDYRARLETYRDLGCNLLRVWGGAFLEKEIFYSLCDELGLLVWQEFPLSSSGAENWPPEDPRSIEELAQIAESYITRRQHHASLLLWCGGNELQGSPDGSKSGIGKPVDTTHPLLQRFADITARLDPDRRFLPTSASGPRFTAETFDFGQGLHWDVHGPWHAESPAYWQNDDALFRSEVGTPGASPAALIQHFAGDLAPLPATLENPLWRRFSWWIQGPQFLAAHQRPPHTLEEFVVWSQNAQAESLAHAARACKQRFPACGGILIWMGHDSFPCPANTSILDFHGHPKPAALALQKIFNPKSERTSR